MTSSLATYCRQVQSTSLHSSIPIFDHPSISSLCTVTNSSGCASPLSIDGVAFGVGTWSTSRIPTVQVGQTVLDRYTGGFKFFLHLTVDFTIDFVRGPLLEDNGMVFLSFRWVPVRCSFAEYLPVFVVRFWDLCLHRLSVFFFVCVCQGHRSQRGG